MNRRTLLAEFVGTFTLAFAVRLSALHLLPPVMTPIVAGLVLGIFVYTVGPVSGAHLNPAVTVGLLSVRKIKPKAAAFTILAQLLGAVIALLLSMLFIESALTVSASSIDLVQIFGEALGAFFLAFGIASVVWGKTPDSASGLVIGSSLLLGILVAAPFSAGILNPAVAVALSPERLAIYLLAPFVGTIVGFHLYAYIVGGKSKK